MPTATATKWRDLIVSEGEADAGTTLGELIDVDDSSLLRATVENGQITTWPQLYVAAPGEDPDHNTPVVPVDWSGFDAEYRRVQAYYHAEEETNR